MQTKQKNNHRIQSRNHKNKLCIIIINKKNVICNLMNIFTDWKNGITITLMMKISLLKMKNNRIKVLFFNCKKIKKKYFRI